MRDILLPQLESEASAGHIKSTEVEIQATPLTEALSSQRPWELTTKLASCSAALRELYVKRRSELLRQQDENIEEALESIKLRDGMDLLNQDQQHQVLEHIRSARFPTKPESTAPSLSDLRAQFPARLRAAIDKAHDHLDSLREDLGERPTVTISLQTHGRELDSADALDRFLGELRARIEKELEAGHRVRLK